MCFVGVVRGEGYTGISVGRVGGFWGKRALCRVRIALASGRSRSLCETRPRRRWGGGGLRMSQSAFRRVKREKKM